MEKILICEDSQEGILREYMRLMRRNVIMTVRGFSWERKEICVYLPNTGKLCRTYRRQTR